MEKYLLVGNGINIELGGLDNYSNSAIMKRVVGNIKAGKYTELTENSLTLEEQLNLLECLVQIIDNIKAGKYLKNADGLFMLMELDRIKRTYPSKSTIDSIFMEDYFLAFEVFNNDYKKIDGEKTSAFYLKVMFDFLHCVLVDGIYNEGKINDLYKNAYPGLKQYLDKFVHIFTTNYDYNIEKITETREVCHLHGEFNRLSPKYDPSGLYYKANQTECEALIPKIIDGMKHIYCDSIMSWSWLEKYGELIEPDAKTKETLFKSISGQVEILGLSPNNDEHLFSLLNQNPNIISVVYYYLKNTDIQEIPHHIKKPITFKKVEKLWNSMK